MKQPFSILTNLVHPLARQRREAGSWLRNGPDQPPQMRETNDDTPITRHVTWLELFFDLVFVVAVAELAHILHDHPDVGGFVTFAALFVPVWWIWIGFSYFADQFESDSAPFRVVMMAVMLLSLVLATTLHGATNEYATKFVIVYVLLRLILIGLYVWAYVHNAQGRSLIGRYIAGFSLGAGIWVVSLLVPPPLRFGVWTLALVVEIGASIWAYLTAKEWPLQVSHMPERFGLFTIIVLGEAVVAVASGTASIEFGWRGALVAALSFAAAASLWWLYFDYSDESVINRAIRSNSQTIMLSFVYGYSHPIIFMGITATGVGSEFAIEAVNEPLLALGARVAFGGGAAVAVLGLTMIQWASPRSLPRSVIAARLLLAALMLLVATLAAVDALALVGVVTLALLALTAFERLRERQQPALVEEAQTSVA